MNMLTVVLVILALFANLNEIKWLSEALLLGAAAIVAMAISPIKIGMKIEKHVQKSTEKYQFEGELERLLYWALNPKNSPEVKQELSIQISKYFMGKKISKEVSCKVLDKTVAKLISHMEDGSLDHIENAWHKDCDFTRLKKLVKIHVVEL